MTDTEGLDTVILIPSNFEAVDSTERVQLSMPDESPTRSLHRQFHVRGLVSSFYSSGSRQKNISSHSDCNRLLLEIQKGDSTIDALLQCFGRTRSQNIIPCVISNGGTITVAMKNAAPSILGSSWTPNNPW
jgi:hypothetical protein